MALRLLLDCADPLEWEHWLPSGLFQGVTTNPTLLRRAGQPCNFHHLGRLHERAVALGCRELHLQTWGVDGEQQLATGRALAALDPQRVFVKVPITRTGAAVARQLIAEGVPVTFTACYEVAQVLVAAALGADGIAAYLGRISDRGRDGHGELIAMQRALEGVGSSTRLLVASLRQPGDLARLAAAGLAHHTISPAIAQALFASLDTAAAAEQFEKDAQGG
ncbi:MULTISPECIES: transaldolase family protein [unclassified Cyanobium]|uniref:transaldolase family protein n=1 Tax=unclassified Cyanobium TaxID=2627006 RepID=UPI0020CC0181|nr:MULTISPECIES: transaldolase family protein [unclassified Cyanobium]MCP9858372.1 transaldolase [Cyanobium sp. Cruz-8H5]MCP9865544.1 transaldolase [Cyanobium sp. Cruz-8D1]